MGSSASKPQSSMPDILGSSGVEVIAHIGLMKTGTTFLQSQIFPHLNGVQFLKSSQSLFSRQLLSKEEIFLISDEGMSGCPYWSAQRCLSYPEQFALSVSRLKEMLPRARVICCFREPAGFLQSAYKQYLHEGGTLPFDLFFRANGEGCVSKGDLMFTRFVDHLRRSFNEDDLFLYDVDDFQRSPGAVLEEMLAFMGTSADVTRLLATARARSNPSVPLHLEGLLIRLNLMNQKFRKVTGRHLQIRCAGKTLNGRVFAQYIAPRFLKGSDTRDLSSLRAVFSDDWTRCKSMLRQF